MYPPSTPPPNQPPPPQPQAQPGGFHPAPQHGYPTQHHAQQPPSFTPGAPYNYAPPHPYRQPNGVGAWGVGLIVFFFLPFFSSIAAGIAMIILGRMQRTKGPLAAENGRRAANWGLTYTLATVVTMLPHFIILFAFDDRIPSGFYPMGIFVTLWGVVTLLHIVVSIVGLVMANGNKVVKWNGIPFFRS